MTPRLHASFRSSAPNRASAAPLDGGPAPRGEAGARHEAEGHRPPAKAAFIAAALGGALLLPVTAAAQNGGWVSFNGATQATATTFTNNVGFIEFHEDADFDADYAVGTGAVFDGGAGVRLANASASASPSAASRGSTRCRWTRASRTRSSSTGPVR